MIRGDRRRRRARNCRPNRKGEVDDGTLGKHYQVRALLSAHARAGRISASSRERGELALGRTVLKDRSPRRQPLSRRSPRDGNWLATPLCRRGLVVNSQQPLRSRRRSTGGRLHSLRTRHLSKRAHAVGFAHRRPREDRLRERETSGALGTSDQRIDRLVASRECRLGIPRRPVRCLVEAGTPCRFPESLLVQRRGWPLTSCDTTQS